MSVSILDDHDHWRKRAEDARHAAEQLDDPVAKAAMIKIAKQYELIAGKRGCERSAPGR